MIYFPQPPLDIIPPGGDQNKAPLLRAIIGLELGVCSMVIAARFYTRLRLVRNAGLDDWIMFATYLCAVIASSLAFAGLSYGIGRHVFYLGHENGVKAMKFDWVYQAFMIWAIITGKISVAFFILRLSNTRWHTWFLQTFNALLVILGVPCVAMTYAQCKPAALLWDPSLHGYCWDPFRQGTYAIFQGSFGAMTDLLYALFPVLILWKLQVPLKRKLLLASIMCLGVFSAIAAAVKTYFLQQLKSRADFTYDGTSLMIWATTEMYVIIIAGSLPTLRPLVLKAVEISNNRSTGRKGYMQHRHALKGNSHPLEPYNMKNKFQRSSMPNQLSGSDQDILPPGITKTTDIAIDYGSKKNRTGKRQVDWDTHGDDLMEVFHAVGAVERV